MFPHVSVRPAALRRPMAWRAAPALLALVSALAAFGCAQELPPAGATAADPGARVPSVRYRPVLGTYRGARPVEPKPWTGAPNKEGAR